MIKKSWISLMLSAALLALPLAALAEYAKIKIGKVVAAEASTRSVEISGVKQTPYEVDYKKPVYVIMVLRLDEKRSISMLDYSLKLGETIYPCLGVARNLDAFFATPEPIFPQAEDLTRMVFVLDGEKLNAEEPLFHAALKYNLDEKVADVPINLSNIGGADFSLPVTIPLGGILKTEKK